MGTWGARDLRPSRKTSLRAEKNREIWRQIVEGMTGIEPA